mmetsp:Transcript_23136/g.75199  ORF Transcript_23136/g.75199 Transcript_23136/m.75199 type:complete len:204 (-) Transcript_23136:149-760(-)
MPGAAAAAALAHRLPAHQLAAALPAGRRAHVHWRGDAHRVAVGRPARAHDAPVARPRPRDDGLLARVRHDLDRLRRDPRRRSAARRPLLAPLRPQVPRLDGVAGVHPPPLRRRVGPLARAGRAGPHPRPRGLPLRGAGRQARQVPAARRRAARGGRRPAAGASFDQGARRGQRRRQRRRRRRRRALHCHSPLRCATRICFAPR